MTIFFILTIYFGCNSKESNSNKSDGYLRGKKIYKSVIDGPAALSYNPANIVWLQGTQVEFMHNQWFLNSSHNFVGVVIPLSIYRSTIGFNYVGLNYDDQPVRTVNRPEGTGEM